MLYAQNITALNIILMNTLVSAPIYNQDLNVETQGEICGMFSSILTLNFKHDYCQAQALDLVKFKVHRQKRTRADATNQMQKHPTQPPPSP